MATYVHIHIPTYIRIHIYTYIHTHTQAMENKYEKLDIDYKELRATMDSTFSKHLIVNIYIYTHTYIHITIQTFTDTKT